MERHVDFDTDALYAALDEQRRARGMSWHEAARDISSQFRDAPARPISPSTLTSLRDRRVIEGDGVLQMLRWLGRAPESFVPGHPATATLPDAPPNRILRFDSRLLYDAVNSQRLEREMTWRQVASEIRGVSVASLTRLSKGGRTGFPHVVRIAAWLDRPVVNFIRAVDR